MATEQTMQRVCDATDDPTRLLYCDDYADGVPWLTQIKLSGTIPLPFKIQLGVGFQTYKRFLATTGTVVADHADDAVRGELHRSLHARRAGESPA